MKSDGTESWLYYIACKYKDLDITIYTKTADAKQIQRLRKYVRVKLYHGERIQCDKAFFCYNPDIIDNVEAKEYIQVYHTDYYEQGLPFTHNPKITKHIAVSQLVADSFKKHYGIECEVHYNPIDLDKPKKVLNLVSATRLTKEKGKSRIIQLAKMLEDAGIPFIWNIFTNDKKEIVHPNIAYMDTQLDITPYIANADYLVQLSDKGEGFGYTPYEALCLGTPVIVTPCEAFMELGIKDGINGFILDYDMKNIDVQKIYKKIPKFEYEPLEDNYDKLFAKGKSTYKEDIRKEVEVQCIHNYTDIELKKTITINDKPYKVKLPRAEYLQGLGLVKIKE